MAKDSISFEFVKKLCGSNKDQIHMLSDQELGEFTRAVCNYYLLDKPKEPEFKDRFLELLWKRMVPKIDKYLNTEEEPRPKHQRIEVKAQLVYTTEQKSEVDELDPELMYKEEDEVDDQTPASVELTENEQKFLDILKECKSKNGIEANGSFKAPAKELRKGKLSDGRVFKETREGLVAKGLIKYEYNNSRERMYWLLNTPVVEPKPVVNVVLDNTDLNREEQLLFYYIQRSRAKRDADGWFKAPVVYLDNATGLGYRLIAMYKESLKNKGYIDYKLGDGKYHYFKVLKEYNYKQIA